MPFCKPKPAVGSFWIVVGDAKDENFALEEQSSLTKVTSLFRGAAYRLILRQCMVEIANANTREDALKDWHTAIRIYNQEVEQVGSTKFSDHHLLALFEALWEAEHPEHATCSSDLDHQDAILLSHLFAAIKNDSKNEVNRILNSSGEEILRGHNGIGQQPLHIAVSEGNIEMVQFLISKGADINSKELATEFTPLHIACHSANLSMVAFLLKQKGIQVMTITETNMFVALHFLLSHSYENQEKELNQVLKQMVAMGASLDSKTVHGQTPLHKACLKGNLAGVKFLLEHDVDVNTTDCYGETALHYAIRGGDRDVAIELMTHHIDVAIKGEFGTARDLADDMKREDLCRTLDAYALIATMELTDETSGSTERGSKSDRVSDKKELYCSGSPRHRSLSAGEKEDLKIDLKTEDSQKPFSYILDVEQQLQSKNNLQNRSATLPNASNSHSTSSLPSNCNNSNTNNNVNSVVENHHKSSPRSHNFPSNNLRSYSKHENLNNDNTNNSRHNVSKINLNTSDCKIQDYNNKTLNNKDDKKISDDSQHSFQNNTGTTNLNNSNPNINANTKEPTQKEKPIPPKRLTINTGKNNNTNNSNITTNNNNISDDKNKSNNIKEKNNSVEKNRKENELEGRRRSREEGEEKGMMVREVGGIAPIAAPFLDSLQTLQNKSKFSQISPLPPLSSSDLLPTVSDDLSYSILLGTGGHVFKLIRQTKPVDCYCCHTLIFPSVSRNAFLCCECGIRVHVKCRKECLFSSPCSGPDTPLFDPSSLPLLSSVNNSSLLLSVDMLGEEIATQNKEVKVEEKSKEGESRDSVEEYKVFTPLELHQIFDQFNEIDDKQTGAINQKQLGAHLGVLMNNPGITGLLFNALDPSKSNKVTFSMYCRGMAVMTKGSLGSTLEYAFKMADLDKDRYINRTELKLLVDAIYQALEAVDIRLPDDTRTFFEKIVLLMGDVEGKISLPMYKRCISQNPLFFESLGMLYDNDSHVHIPHLDLNQSKKASIVFGHKDWNMVQNMMLGIRRSVGETTSLPTRELKQKDFVVVVDLRLAHSGWIFRDFSPMVFRKIREFFWCNARAYMFSLGPEKILGNALFMGRLCVLCEVVSTARSGSFFFKSNDGKYFVKTLPSDEFLFFRKILPSYYHYVSKNPNTLITRFYGLHNMRNSTRDVSFCVMENIFSAQLAVHEQYDMKGSEVDRMVEVDEDNPNPNIALKDLNFLKQKRKLKLGSQRKALLMEQIEKDTTWMESLNICDYSFLVGIHTIDKEDESTYAANQRRHQDQSIFKDYLGGMLSEGGDEIYYVAIIDNLCQYSTKKKSERLLKSFLHDSVTIFCFLLL
eukprot:CAMPEP_0174256474 /NCGR_PEP_ID=MMETSP0439-20130205/5696_1 /TAXON_ID=0 /ORGANISM="Stereomyxa ramosa, Strain Chinc5" /LENGTH=1331 /DNA_ID=CAMNT_0015339093 /DNA_START=87 /DNA_END=4078 /DNA_ORIENTATION=+